MQENDIDLKATLLLENFFFIVIFFFYFDCCIYYLSVYTIHIHQMCVCVCVCSLNMVHWDGFKVLSNCIRQTVIHSCWMVVSQCELSSVSDKIHHSSIHLQEWENSQWSCYSRQPQAGIKWGTSWVKIICELICSVYFVLKVIFGSPYHALSLDWICIHV